MSHVSHEHDAPSSAEDFYVLRLYVAGQTPRAALAQVNLESVCATYLEGRHEIEVVDLLDHPTRARTDGVIAVPTLVRFRPEPVRKIVGDLSDRARLVAGLEIVDPEVGGRAS